MRTKNLSNEERRCIAEFLLQNSADGRVVNSGLVEASKKWEISKKSVQRIWAIAKQQKTAGLSLNVESKKKGKQGPNKMKLDEGKVKAIPFKSRCTIRRLAQKLGVGKSTVGRWVVSGAIKSHTNAIKPQLNEANKLHRLRFSILNLVHDKLLNLTKFKDMHYTLHMDEKWFNLSKASEKYYMLPSERHPYRSCKSKNYIPKIMLMGVVGRPMYGSNREVIFDGKIGMFPFVYKENAKRNSKNRRAGTPVTKSIESITKEVIKETLIHKVIPAIKQLWPPNASKNITIQQDNTRPHISNEDPEFRAAASSDGFNIILSRQPPNSPDLNVLDLGFFRAIQSLQTETAAYTLDELLLAVHDAFTKLDASTLNKVFLSLQACMLEIMKIKGGNDYALPHMNKDALERQGVLPTDLNADNDMVRECIDYLVQQQQTNGMEELITEMGYIAQ